VFHTKKYRHGRKTYNSEVCVKRSTSNKFKVDYYGKLEEVIELQYHSKHNIIFLFKFYWYDTADKEIRVDPYYGLVEINSKARLCNVDNVFVFTKQCQQVYYIYNPSFRNDRLRVDWLSIVKIKLRGRVEVVQDRNNELIMGDDVFQLGELVYPYRVALSNDLEDVNAWLIKTFASPIIFLLMLTLQN
jgi:hypothetical protein